MMLELALCWSDRIAGYSSGTLKKDSVLRVATGLLESYITWFEEVRLWNLFPS